MAEPLPKPAFSLVWLARELAGHDGDDRNRYLRGALDKILEARESAENCADFVSRVDAVLEELSDDLGPTDE